MRVAAGVFLIALFAYLGNASGLVDPTDAEASIDTARVLYERGTLKIFPGPADTYFHYDYDQSGPNNFFYGRSPDNGWYSKMGLLMPVLYLPAVIIGKSSVKHGEFVLRFLISLVNSLVGATIVLTIFLIVRRYATERWALTLAFTVGFATLILPYAKFCHREPVQALALVSLIYFTVVSKPLPAALAGAAGILTKQAYIIPLLPLAIWSLLKFPDRKQRLQWLLPPFVALAVWAIFNWGVFGHPLKSGYSPAVQTFHRNVWSTPLHTGIWAQWLSPETGLFWYSPILIVPFVLSFFRRQESLDRAVIASVVLQTLLYARWQSPTGHESLGPRYLVVIVPLFAIWFRHPPAIFTRNRIVRAAVVALLLVSLAEQIVNTSVRPQQFWTLKSENILPEGYPQWKVNARLFVEKVAGRAEMYCGRDFGQAANGCVDFRNSVTLVGMNYWWLHARKFNAWLTAHR